VSCGFSRDTLALYVEDDLPPSQAAATAGHLATCEHCRRFADGLRVTQRLLKSTRAEGASRPDCVAMRHEVMSMINDGRGSLGWGLRLERAIALAFMPSYALAALLLLGMVSVTVLAQIRPAAHDTLAWPEGYRQWTQLPSADRVYINPPSYQAYTKTGIFPEGTVFVWEAGPEREGVAGGHTGASTLVSFKDGKAEDGWAFFDFSGSDGTAPTKARALPESRGCRACHRQSPLSMGA
jgi:hypothetical protein